jgi:TrmH family RNA methyltransferase
MRIEPITSRENQHLVNARKVRDGKVPGKMFIEGTRLVHEALQSDIVVDECLVSDDFDRDTLRGAFHGVVFEVPGKLFRSIADTENSQGVVIIAQRPNTVKLTCGATSALPITIYLHEINNPSNLGAVIRTAEAAGVTGVIVSKHSTDVFSPKALRAAMGSSFRVRIREGVDFDGVIEWAKDNGLVVTAADVSARRSYINVDWKKPRVLIFGSEAHGLTDAQLKKVDEQTGIPMENGIESLNLAVSAGIVLFEAKRQNNL